MILIQFHKICNNGFRCSVWSKGRCSERYNKHFLFQKQHLHTFPAPHGNAIDLLNKTMNPLAYAELKNKFSIPWYSTLFSFLKLL